MNHIDFLLKTNPDKLTKRLGRLPAKDPNDKKYLIPRMAKAVQKTSQYWNDNPVFLDQLDTPRCVEYSFHHLILDGPVRHGNKKQIWEFGSVYKQAQEVDEWEGTNYDGTSVRAGAKVLQSMGLIKEYRWAFDLNTMIQAVLNVGPVVIGVDWFYDMFVPDKKGLIKATGGVAGGHAIEVTGVNTKTKLFRLKQSWGRGWGLNGRCFISFSDMEMLIANQGEICLPIENTFK